MAQSEQDLMARAARPTIDEILMYESGVMDHEEMIEFFSRLVASGLAWELQGSYGRVAADLIRIGVLNNEGDILRTEIDA
jgi:hypothetical protein